MSIARKWINFFGGAIHNSSEGAVPYLMECYEKSKIYKAMGITDEDYIKAIDFARYSDLRDDVESYQLDMAVKSLDIPIYIMEGRYDYQAGLCAARDFLEKLEAPHKELFIFENSAHCPNIEEPERYHDIMINIILKRHLENI